LQDLQHVVGVRDIGDAADHTLFAGEQGRSENGERGVLRAADVDASFKLAASMNDKFVQFAILKIRFA
jgi:hypothetical protein